jgi:NDP-sugar pyrophosphorylase family protein
MSGFGERFRRAGFEVPKPLIEIDGKPIIAYVIEMFTDEQDFIFICNQDHLNNRQYKMESIIRKFCPTGRIIGIPSHKLGPIHAVNQVKDLIDPDRPVIVNYCDFTCYWDWGHFKKFVAISECDGAIPAYKGFHPHSLGNTNYAYMFEKDGWILDIQEKQPYTNNRMEEFASSGTYYFASGKIMSDAFDATIDQGISVNGEFYVSLAYKPLLAAHKPIAIYPLQHFMQWGTPEDVVEYNGWSSAFRRMAEIQPTAADAVGSLVIPMAGLGQRFVNEGYSITKPLIPVSGKAMALQAVNDLPPSIHHVFVLRSDMADHADITNTLLKIYSNAVIELVPAVTEGQACTALIGLDALVSKLGDVPGPVTFGACDNGALYDQSAFQLLAENHSVDVIVWGVRGHANAVRYPQMYGWIDEKNGIISRVSVKTPLGSPATDPIAIGTFTFRRAEDFRKVVEHLIARNGRINGEFYIDSCINDAIELGLRCYLFEVDSFLSWGTPNDLRTFEYWQSCFHKWNGHPYRLENDSRISTDAVEILGNKYIATIPVIMAPKRLSQ